MLRHARVVEGASTNALIVCPDRSGASGSRYSLAHRASSVQVSLFRCVVSDGRLSRSREIRSASRFTHSWVASTLIFLRDRRSFFLVVVFVNTGYVFLDREDAESQFHARKDRVGITKYKGKENEITLGRLATPLRPAPCGATNGPVKAEEWNGDALRVRRAASDLSLLELKRLLAKRRIHVDPATVQRWERGRIPTDHAKIARALARIFECSSLAFYRRPLVTFVSDTDPDPDVPDDERTDSPW